MSAVNNQDPAKGAVHLSVVLVVLAVVVEAKGCGLERGEEKSAARDW